MTNDEWYEQLKRRHDSKDWSEIERKEAALDIAYAESDHMYRESITGRVSFEHELFPTDTATWSTQYPEIFHLLTLLVDEGALQEEGGYYIIRSGSPNISRHGEIEFSADATGLVADVELQCDWPEPFDAASELMSASGLWDDNEEQDSPSDMIARLAEALIDYIPESSQQYLHAPGIRVRLSFGDEPTLKDVLHKLNALERELCEQNHRAWGEVRTFAKDFLSSLQ